MSIDIEKLGALMRGLFLTDGGKPDILAIICALVAAAYALIVLMTPLAIWRLRRETIKLRRAQQAQFNMDKSTRDALREIAAALADESASVRRTERAAQKRAEQAPFKPNKRASDTSDGEDGKS